jgi:hypothetical protein
MQMRTSDPYESRVIYTGDARLPGATMHRINVQDITTRPWPRVYYVATRVHAPGCPRQTGNGPCNCRYREELIPHYEH